jgi:hypothetical protein
MTTKQYLILSLIFGLVAMTMLGCRKTPQSLLGRWVSTSIEDVQTKRNLPDSTIQLVFFENKRYHYSQNFRILEAGRYYVTNPNVYLTDTLRPTQVEQKLKIFDLTDQNLSILLGMGGSYYKINFNKAQPN